MRRRISPSWTKPWRRLRAAPRPTCRRCSSASISTTLALLAAGIAAIGTGLYRSRWAVAALLAACTLRHAIAKSGTNSLEGYFHPRQLAFAFGVIAVAAFLRGRLAFAALALAAAGSLHPTTTLWFAIWLSVAAIATARARWPVPIAIAVVAIVAWWTFTFGPLAGRLTLMDAEWLEALSEKDYLFPLRWPLSAWIANLAYVPIILLIYRSRREVRADRPATSEAW